MPEPQLSAMRTATDPTPGQHARADALVEAVEAVLATRGRSVMCVPVRAADLPERTWENGASLQLFCGVDDVQDFALFAGNRGAGAMVRWLFSDGEDELATGPQLNDGLAETLNHVVGRLKKLEAAQGGIEPKLDTPQFLDRGDAEMYVHVHPASALVRVTSDAWGGEVVFMASPKRQRAIAAIEQATALLIRSGLEPGATVRACRLLEVARSPVLALSALPSMGITLSWCVENLAALVNGIGGSGERTIFYRVLGELEDLLAALVRLTAPPETTALVIAGDEELRPLLRDFCHETLAGIERTRNVLSPGVDDAPHSPFGLMHTVQVTAGFLHLEQLQCLARSTGRLLGSVRACRARLTDRQFEAVGHSVDLIGAWVEALLVGLDGDGTVAWSAELEAHTRMLDHVLECGGQIVIHRADGVVPTGTAQVREILQLDLPQLLRLEAVRDEMRQWAESSRAEPGERTLAESGEFLERAHEEINSICQSVRRVPLGPILARLAQHCREASARHGKLVRVDATGDSLHAPEHLMNAMAGPLVHLVNNAIQHGIEDSAERGREGKKILALVQLRAERVEGSLILEVTDDGRGIQPEVMLGHDDRSSLVLDTAGGDCGGLCRLRLRSPTPTPLEAHGRFGLDVVVREVEAAGGVVELESVQGKGTRVRIVLTESDESPPEVDSDEFADLQAGGELIFL